MQVIIEGRNAINIRVCTLASGSKGNCIFVEGRPNGCGSTGGVKILVDAGLSLRETKSRLNAIGVKPEEISAVIISHDHRDHVQGLGPVARGLGIPVYITEKTWKTVHPWQGNGYKVIEFEAGTAFEIGGLTVEPFSTPHDAADPVGFCFYAGNAKAGIATDLGHATGLVTERLKGCNLLLLESNHDPAMLKDGPYPWPLKQRVAGKEGHLSNEDAGKLLSDLVHQGLRHVILAHLSQTNNLPRLAHKSASEALAKCSCGQPTGCDGEIELGV
ncbi:MAG: MBL fold metallo-hydrolase, partial [Nitrospirota bacterium]